MKNIYKIVKLNSLDYINNPPDEFEEITLIDYNGQSLTGIYHLGFLRTLGCD